MTRPGAVLLALALAACAAESADPLAPPDAGAAPRGEALVAPSPGTALAAPGSAPGSIARAPADVPEIYLALQPDPGGPTSVVLAIDAGRDNTPSNDPAIRITPDNGQCNPQQLRFFNFPPERARRPIYGPDEAARGITARELPDYMAQAVTSEMMSAGLIDDPEESQPQNVCTRKLLQRMILDRSAATG